MTSKACKNIPYTLHKDGAAVHNLCYVPGCQPLEAAIDCFNLIIY